MERTTRSGTIRIPTITDDVGPADGYLRVLLDLCIVRGWEVMWVPASSVYLVVVPDAGALFKHITLGAAGEARLQSFLGIPQKIQGLQADMVIHDDLN